jgi:hypothetical protein
MTEFELRSLATECYGVFNAAKPASGGAAWRVWAEMCAGIPVIAAPYIIAQFAELESMPRNFGKAVRQFGQEWKQAHGIKSFVDGLCPDCDREIPGHFWAFDFQGGAWHWFAARCACNCATGFEAQERMTKKQAVESGLTVIPSGDDCGFMAFLTRLEGGEVLPGGKFSLAAGSRDFRKRAAHLSMLAEMDS